MTLQQLTEGFSLKSFFNFVSNFRTENDELMSLCENIIEDDCFPKKSINFKEVVDHLKIKHSILDYGIVLTRRLFVLYVKEVHGLDD